MKEELKKIIKQIDLLINESEKHKTIDDIANEISYTTKDKVLDYLKNNKQQIIETLKNL